VAVGLASLAGLRAAGDRRVDRFPVGQDRLRLAVGTQGAQLVETGRLAGRLQPRQRPFDQLAFGIAVGHLLQGLGGGRGGRGGAVDRGRRVRRRRLGQPRLRLAATPQLGMNAGDDPPQPLDLEGGNQFLPRVPGSIGLAGEELGKGFVEGLAGGAGGLGGVEHAEARVDPGRHRVPGQEAVAEAVDRRHPGTADSRQQLRGPLGSQLGPSRQLGADPLAQLGRGLVGEGEGEDRVGGDFAVADKAAVALHHHPGLAGAGAGLEQDVAAADLDRRRLLWGRPALAHRSSTSSSSS
jgi:hypothetical protein